MADASFDIRSIINQVKRAFQGLTSLQKSMVVAITAILLMFLAGLVVWANQDHMALLVSGLDPLNANAVVESLNKQGVKHKISADQSTIYVPEKQVSPMRLRIAGEGILSGDKVGFEKLESPGLTTTDFSQRTVFWLAKQRELEKTLREGLPHIVKAAKVTITPAKDSIFVSDKEDAKASVVLTLFSRNLPPDEITQTIANLVSHSVEALKPENVVISDQQGRQLNRRDSQAKITDVQRRMQREEEEHLIDRVVEQLEPAVGQGKVKASARVELDFDKVAIDETRYNPLEQVERSVQTLDEKTTKREPPLGIPGTPTNVAPADATALGGNLWETKDLKESTTNYEISATNRKQEKAPGSIKRVTISVLLDERTTYEKNSRGYPELRPIPWKEEELEKFRQLVVGAVGIDNARGDIVIVDSLPFLPATNPQDEFNANRQYLLNWAKTLAPFAIILIAFIGWLIYRMATRKKEPPAEIATLIQVKEIDETEGEEVPAEKPPPKQTLEDLRRQLQKEIDDENELTRPDQLRRDFIKERITEIIVSDPETAASLVRSWLVDDEVGGK